MQSMWWSIYHGLFNNSLPSWVQDAFILNLLECKEEQVWSKHPPVALKIQLSEAHSPDERDVTRKHRSSCWLTRESAETQTTPQDRELPIAMIHPSSSKAQSRACSAPPKEWEWKSSCTVGWGLQTSQHFWTSLLPKAQQIPKFTRFCLQSSNNSFLQRVGLS